MNPTASMTSDDRTAYSAPALEKGLDILELLAAEPEPMTARQIGERLGRSKSEIFRMVYVLVERGYLVRDPATDRLSLSNRLFELGMRTPRSRTLVEVALPEMNRLADAVGHASHLVMVSNGQTVVIANAAPPSTPFNFFLRLGYGNAATEAVSGQTIIAFQTPERRAAMIRDARRRLDGGNLPEGLDAHLDAIASTGSVVARSRHLVGVIDVCAPILDRSGHAVASIVVPCLQSIGRDEDFEAVRTRLLATCAAVSEAIL
jgi:DNA-binding IclR family transcriptional regulator